MFYFSILNEFKIENDRKIKKVKAVKQYIIVINKWEIKQRKHI